VPLSTPRDGTTRPTAARTREALFSMLTSRLGSFEGLVVADIFAGSGALGLEALSRGAARCVFVEKDGAALGALNSNLYYLEANPIALVLHRAVETVGPIDASIDLAFLDPPYLSGDGPRALERLDALGWFAPHAWAGVETERSETVSAKGWEVAAERIHGRAKLTLLRRV
jgi:16S rRNA (guanine966-N2)-methyltransferase